MRPSDVLPDPDSPAMPTASPLPIRSDTSLRMRSRRLLLHRAEINKLIGKVKEKGYALVPLKLYFKHGLVKMELALAVGKKLYDKRQDMAKRDAKREMERALKDRNR